MKICGTCETEKQLDQFAWRNKAKGVRHNCCRACQKIASAQWYEANRTRQRENVAANNVRHQAAARALVRAAKDVPCMDCGQRYPYYVMDLDHVRGKKVMHVGSMASRRFSLEKLRQEIAKCDPVCANCHRVRTWNRSQDASVA